MPSKLVQQFPRLKQLEYGRSYFVHVTAADPITPVLGVSNASPTVTSLQSGAVQLNDVASNDLSMAPSVVCGSVHAPSSDARFVGKEIWAEITDFPSADAQLCAVTTIQEAEDGSCFYILRIDSTSLQDDCGAEGALVELFIEGKGRNPSTRSGGTIARFYDAR